MPKRSRGKATRKPTPAPKSRSRQPKRPGKRAPLDISSLVIDQTEGGGVLPKTPDGQDPIAAALGRRRALKISSATAVGPAQAPKRDSALRAARARWDHKRTR